MSDDSSEKNDFKSLLVKGTIGAVALVGSTAIPIVVQQSLQSPSTPTASPTVTVPAQVSPSPTVAPAQVSPDPTVPTQVVPGQLSPAQVAPGQLSPVDPAALPPEVQPSDHRLTKGEWTTTKVKRRKGGDDDDSNSKFGM
jgi:hypothetical protein